MMWLIQLWAEMPVTPRALNLAFALLSLASAFGLGPRWVGAVSSLLYLALAFA